MSDEVFIAAIVALPPTIASVAALIMAVQVKTKLQEVHHQINSRFDEWIKMTQVASHAEGVKDEKNRSDLEDHKNK